MDAYDVSMYLLYRCIYIVDVAMHIYVNAYGEEHDKVTALHEVIGSLLFEMNDTEWLQIRNDWILGDFRYTHECSGRASARILEVLLGMEAVVKDAHDYERCSLLCSKIKASALINGNIFTQYNSSICSMLN